MPSPRDQLLAGLAECLQVITVANGYRTDAGLHVVREPGQVPADDAAVIAPVIERQARATEAALVRTHRLTTVALVAKVQAAQGDAQERLDAIVSDIEQAMDARQTKFPVGIQYPQYVEMQPIPPEAGMGWTGALIRYQSHIPIR